VKRVTSSENIFEENNKEKTNEQKKEEYDISSVKHCYMG
jgi:hypothetical protein